MGNKKWTLLPTMPSGGFQSLPLQRGAGLCAEPRKMVSCQLWTTCGLRVPRSSNPACEESETFSQGDAEQAHGCLEISRLCISLYFDFSSGPPRNFYFFLLQLKIVPSHENRDRNTQNGRGGGCGVLYTLVTECYVFFYVLFSYNRQDLLKTLYSPTAAKLLMIQD